MITATGRNGVMAVDRRTLTAYGDKIGAISDPTGDDNGPGSYTYPTDGAFNAGSLDLTGLEVYEDGDTVRFVASTAGPINNPWGGNGMSTQRLNIYLSDGRSTATTQLLPGTNTSAKGAWTYAIVADGRYDSSRFGSGVYRADEQKAGTITLDVIPAGKIIASVPASALTGVDLSTAGYQVSMFSDAEDGEGIGNIRPVYSAECARGINCPSFVGPVPGRRRSRRMDRHRRLPRHRHQRLQRPRHHLGQRAAARGDGLDHGSGRRPVRWARPLTTTRRHASSEGQNGSSRRPGGQRGGA